MQGAAGNALPESFVRQESRHDFETSSFRIRSACRGGDGGAGLTRRPGLPQAGFWEPNY
jgi:hypothetical protein